MASPDVTPYVDLRILDLDPQTIFDNAKASLLSSLPTWIPRETATEVLLLEALAISVSEAAFRIDRLPSAITEVLLKLFSITRSAGAAPTVTLTFHMIGTAGYTIPVATTVRLALPGGADPIIFTTDVALTIAPGGSTGTVAATGDRFTTEANGIASATVVDLLETYVTVDYVALGSDVTGGLDAETDLTYFTRATQRFGRLSDTLVVPRHFIAAAEEQTYIVRALALDDWDGSGGSPGDDPGHVTVAVYGDGTTVSGGNKTALATLLGDAAQANLAVHVIDAGVTSVDVDVSVQGLAGYDAATITDNVQAALTAYLSTDTWDWGGTVRLSELYTVVNNATGVDYVIGTLADPTMDVTLSGHAPLVTAGTLDVTVTEA